MMKKKTIGMYCQKYIVRNLESEEKKLEYAKVFFQLYQKMGYSKEEALTYYAATMTFSNGTYNAYTYMDITQSQEKFYELVMSDVNIKEYKTCSDFCKNVNKKIQSCCKMCPQSKNVKSQNSEQLKKELQMIHYISSGPEALDIFLKNSNAGFFSALYDLAGDIDYPYPVMIPLLKVCYNIIKEYGMNYYTATLGCMQTTNTEKERLLRLNMRIFKEIRSKYGKSGLEDLLKKNNKIFDTVWTIIVEEMLGLPLFSNEEALHLLQEKDTTVCVKEEPKNIDNSSPILIPVESSINRKTKVETAENTIREIKPIKGEDKKEETLKEKIPEQCAPLGKVGEQENESKSKYSQIIDEKNNMQRATCKDDYQMLPVDGIYLPNMPHKYLEKFFYQINKENAKDIKENAIIDKSVSLECVTNEEGELFLLIWDRRSRKYHYAYFTSLPDEIKDILTYTSILKICYQPYLLYAITRNFGIKLCHVFSFYTLSRALFVQDINLEYREMVELYTEGKSYRDDSYGCPVINDFIGGMPFYRQISAVMQKLMTSIESYKDKMDWQLLQDEIIGVSYLRCNFATEDSTLLSLFEDGEVSLNQEVPQEYSAEGYVISYEMETDSMDRPELYDLYMQLLIKLAKEGRFRKHKVYLITFKEGKVILYMEKRCKELLDTIITIRLHRYAINNQIGCMNIKKTITKVEPT